MYANQFLTNFQFTLKICILEKVHGKGIFHRDIKPDNLLFKGDRLVLTDFGLAKKKHDTHPYEIGKKPVIGTLRYISPRTELGEPVTEIDELIAVGYVGVHLKCGSLPWIGAGNERYQLKIKFNEMVGGK